MSGAEPARRPVIGGGAYRCAGSSRAVPRERGDWRACHSGIAAAISHGAPVPLTAHDVVWVMELIAPGRRSAGEGRRIALR